MRKWSKRAKAFAETSRGEQSFLSFLDLKGGPGYAERAQELIASLLHVPSKIAHVSHVSLAKPCKPSVL
jgi:hypothetical protein